MEPTPNPTDVGPASPEPPRSPESELFRGFGWAMLLSLGGLMGCAILLPLVTVYGVIQLAWMWPLATRFKRQARPHAARGVWLAAALVFMLSAACWGSILFNFDVH